MDQFRDGALALDRARSRIAELRCPVQGVERADLDADAAVQTLAVVDREPVEHVAAARAGASRLLLDLEDDIVAACLVARDGQVTRK